MNDAEEQFAARLAEDLERVLGVGIAIDDLDLQVGDGTARVTATLLIGDRVETIEAVGSDALALYRPIIDWVLRAKSVTIILAILALAVTIVPVRQIGTEFMPKLDEGAILINTRRLPSVSLGDATAIGSGAAAVHVSAASDPARPSPIR